MRKFITVFLFFIIFNSNYDILFSQEKPKTLKEIFSPYVNIIDEYIDSDIFFKGWSDLQYLEFLDKLVYIFSVFQDLSTEQQEDIYSFTQYQRNKHRKYLSSEFPEIFGSIFLQSKANNPTLIFIPKYLLDSNVFIDSSITDKQLDGILVKINGDKLILYNVLEARLTADSHNVYKNSQVFQRWKNSGIYILKKLFESKNIWIKTKNDIIPIRDCSFDDFSDIVELYNLNSIERDTPITNDNLMDIPTSIVNSFYSDSAYEILEKVCIDFIDRIIFLLKKYIQICHELPSLSPGITFTLTTGSIRNDKTFSYYLSYFSNQKNRDDLILSLYLIYNSGVFHSIFEERLPKFFSSKDIDLFYRILSIKDKFSLIPYHSNTDKLDSIVNTLLELLGNEYEVQIREYIRNNRMLLLVGKPRNYKTLIEKFRALEQYFGTEKTKNIVLSNLRHFIMIRTSFLKNHLKAQHMLFYGFDNLFYLFLGKYFYRILATYEDELFRNVDTIADMFFKRNIPKALDFTFKNHLETMNSDIRVNIRRNYNLLHKHRNLFFDETFSEEDIDNLILNNINTLVYLKVDGFMDLYNLLRHKLKFSIADIKEIFLKNFRYLHMMGNENLYGKINFIRTYLINNQYTKEDIHEIFTTRLRYISHVSLDSIKGVLEFLTPFLGTEYKYSIYKWLKTTDITFKDLNVDKIMQATAFLTDKFIDQEFVKYFIVSLNDIKYLDIKYLQLLIDCIFEKLYDQGKNLEYILSLFKDKTLDINEILNVLDDKKDIYVLDKVERIRYQKQKIYSWIESSIQKDSIEDKGINCAKFFINDNNI